MLDIVNQAVKEATRSSTQIYRQHNRLLLKKFKQHQVLNHKTKIRLLVQWFKKKTNHHTPQTKQVLAL
jgi:hypothetical protein